MEKRTFKVSDVAGLALSRRKETYIKGYGCGFNSGDQFMSYRIGYSTGFYSYSAQGKTQFWIEEAVHLSKTYGLKHAIWLSENGRKEELITDIAMTYMKKSLFSDKEKIDDDELLEAFIWMEDYFFIIDHETTMLNIRDIYTSVDEIEKTNKIKIDCVAIDNATNLSREAEKQRMLVQEYMNYLMTAINRTSLSKNYHTFILFHVGKTDRIECKDTKKKYQPMPSHYDVVGGQMVNYLGFQLVGVWRPISREEQVGIINPDTLCPYELNETHIIISKSKPKAIGKQGSFTIYFDEDKQCYYEMISGKRYYCGEYKEQHSIEKNNPSGGIQPNYDFDKPKGSITIMPSKVKDWDEDAPF